MVERQPSNVPEGPGRRPGPAAQRLRQPPEPLPHTGPGRPPSVDAAAAVSGLPTRAVPGLDRAQRLAGELGE
jgi:hypothetical protein